MADIAQKAAEAVEKGLFSTPDGVAAEKLLMGLGLINPAEQEQVLQKGLQNRPELGLTTILHTDGSRTTSVRHLGAADCSIPLLTINIPKSVSDSKNRTVDVGSLENQVRQSLPKDAVTAAKLLANIDDPCIRERILQQVRNHLTDYSQVSSIATYVHSDGNRDTSLSVLHLGPPYCPLPLLTLENIPKECK